LDLDDQDAFLAVVIERMVFKEPTEALYAVL
jgi:hypothetical protein